MDHEELIERLMPKTAVALARDRAFNAMEALGKDFKFEIEPRGHRISFECFTPFDLIYKLNAEQLERLAEAWETGTPMDPSVVFAVLEHYSHEQCQWCSASQFLTNGFKIEPMTVCSTPAGLPTRVEIPIPSGRMLVGSDYRDKFALDEGIQFYLNVDYEIQRCVTAYGRVAMAHFFVGNTCPRVYRTGPDHFVIATFPGEVPEGYEEVASVVTDLWWVSIVDGREADRRGVERGDDDEVQVTPGTYVLDYHALMAGFDRDGNNWTEPVIYADFYLRPTVTGVWVDVQAPAWWPEPEPDLDPGPEPDWWE